eukprot:scaffold16787_cov52-Attheya_sp.AAC.3
MSLPVGLGLLWLLASLTGSLGFVRYGGVRHSSTHGGGGGISTSFLCQTTTPSMIVFDLDNTLWTPELYQLRTLQRQRQRQEGFTPVAGTDVKLFEGVQDILEEIRASNSSWSKNVTFAIASRTKSVDWAHDLLRQFDLMDVFLEHVQIFPGDKVQHFKNLHQQSGIPYDQMLFFDDARDGRYGNCVPVSQQLGVLSVHCPDGIHTKDIFHTGMARFAEWTGRPGTIVECDGSVSELPPFSPSLSRAGPADTVSSLTVQNGVVKTFLKERGFGFIRYKGGAKDVFFHVRHLDEASFGDDPNSSTTIDVDEKVSFVVRDDPKSGKKMATQIQRRVTTSTTTTTMTKDEVSMRVFSMNLPFAALLANGYKTLETRNGTMFTPYEPGTKMLLHVGRRTYPDGDRHLQIMASGGKAEHGKKEKEEIVVMDRAEIARLKTLPRGFGRGMAVAIVELGNTYETTLEERCDPEFQRNVGAFGQDSGMRATEIRRVAYLKQGIPISGQKGISKITIDQNLIPDGWL